MEKIGQILKARREELGYSLPKMSERTKVPVAKLQAIEEGNLAYFNQELTYVKFYLRYYFNALHLNFEDYKDVLDIALDEFTQTSALKKIQEQEEISARVKSRVKSRSNAITSKNKKPNIQRRLKTDIGFISMFIISILVVLALIYVFITAVLPMINKAMNDSKVVVVPDPIVHEEDPGDIDEPIETVEFTIIKKDKINYEITGFIANETVTFIIYLPNRISWLSSKVDGVSSVNPARRYYEKGESYTLIVNATENLNVELYVGYLASPKINVNGKDIEIDISLVSSNLKSSFYFTFKGAAQ